jgi:methylenetetrahydrofolate reductase (NADPH)
MSFEFFPPKDALGEERLLGAIKTLERLRPDFISVTYGASGSTRERTISATRFIQDETSVATMGHLTCAAQRTADIRQALAAYTSAGVRHILAVRGDPPGGPTAPWTPHPQGLANATELVSLVKASGEFCVGVAAFPDAHPDTHDFALDTRILKAKEAAGAEFAVTQLFFGADKYFRLVERLRAAGCALPVVPGIMPITNVGQLERFATLSGAALPADLVAALERVQDDPDAVRAVGLEIAVLECRRLLAGGAPGLHFFTQNRSTATAAILSALRQ